MVDDARAAAALAPLGRRATGALSRGIACQQRVTCYLFFGTPGDVQRSAECATPAAAVGNVI